MKKPVFSHSWVWKYMNFLVPFLEKKYKVEFLYQDEGTWFLSWQYWRIFKLPKLLRDKYKWYIKIFTEENFLFSVRDSYIPESVVVIHHYPFLTKVTNFKEEILRWMSYISFNTVLKKLKNIVVVSNKTKSVLLDLWISEKLITVIPNSVDLSCYKSIKKELKQEERTEFAKKYKIPETKKWLLFVWSNESRKNLLTLLKSLWRLPDDYILVRVGKDWSSDELKKMNEIIKKLNIANKYFHLQDLSEEELILLYQISDIYIMPSLYEWFWRPIIEAQACWLPVISTKCWALEEVCWDWALLINNPIDEKEYADKIILMKEKESEFIITWFDNAKKYSNEYNGEKLAKMVSEIN